MEVAVRSSPDMDYFDFNEARMSSPHHHNFLSAPTSPKRFGELSLSAPASPGRVAEFYRQFDDFLDNKEERGGGSGVPFVWEEKPGTPKSSPDGRLDDDDDDDDDFSFNLSVDDSKDSLFAEELFDEGKIKPLKPPPRLFQQDHESPKSPRSPRSSTLAQGKKIIREAFSPRMNKKKVDVDPFATAVENTRKQLENERGRESRLIPSSSRRAARSLSPFRVADSWAEEDVNKQPQQQVPSKHPKNLAPSSSSLSSFSSKNSSSSSSRKWRLKDLLLFRSASEGRASDKDYLRKYTFFFSKRSSDFDAKSTSFRSTDNGSGSQSGSRRSRGQVASAHELHYTMNRAASEDLKKRTFLPYKQGILGKFAFNPSSRK